MYRLRDLTRFWKDESGTSLVEYVPRMAFSSLSDLRHIHSSIRLPLTKSEAIAGTLGILVAFALDALEVVPESAPGYSAAIRAGLIYGGCVAAGIKAEEILRRKCCGFFEMWLAASILWMIGGGAVLQEEIWRDVSTLNSAEVRQDADLAFLAQSNVPGPGSDGRIYQSERIDPLEPEYAAIDAARGNLIHAVSILLLPPTLLFALGWTWHYRQMFSSYVVLLNRIPSSERVFPVLYGALIDAIVERIDKLDATVRKIERIVSKVQGTPDMRMRRWLDPMLHFADLALEKAPNVLFVVATFLLIVFLMLMS